MDASLNAQSRLTSVILLLLASMLVLVLSSQIPGAHAATVTELVTLTVIPAGSPIATFTISGCGQSIPTLTGNGIQQSFTATSGLTCTFTVPAGGANSRDRFTPLSTTWSYTTTASGDIVSNSYYSQLQNNYQATPLAQTTWDGGLAGPTVTGTVLGNGGSAICGPITLAGGAGAATCSGWADYDTAASFGSISGAPTNSRWTCGPCTANGVTSGGSTLNVDYFKQWTNFFEYSVTGGGAGYAPPTLSYTSLGSTSTSILTTSSIAYWVDNAGTASVTNPLTGSGSAERWSISSATGSISSGGGLTIYAYYNQYACTCFYNVLDGGSPMPPTISGARYGTSSTEALSTFSNAIWQDNNAAWSVTNPLGGSGPNERWTTGGATSGTVIGPLTISPTYYHQYLVSLSYAISGGGSPSAPTTSSMRFGVAYSFAISGISTGYWLDSGVAWSITNPLSGSTPAERWRSSGATSGTISSSTAFSLLYYRQYAFTSSYRIIGGGAPVPPLLLSTQFASGYSTSLTGVPTGLWLDASATWSVTNTLTGSGPAERWMTSGITSGTASAATTLILDYYHQYLATIGYSVLGGGSPSPPSLASSQFGAPYSLSATVASTGYWLDSGAPYALSNPLPGSGSSERWQATSAQSGTVMTPFTLAAAYYHQFTCTCSYTVTGGGAPSAPSISGLRFGSSSSDTLSASSATIWLDSGASWTIPNPLASSGSSEQWISNGGTSGTVGATFTANPTYFHQYSISLGYAISREGSPIAPSLSYTSEGSVANVTAATIITPYWMDSGSSWKLTNPLGSSTSSERWAAPTSESVATAGIMVIVTYYHQYAFIVDFTIVGGGRPTAPSVSSTQFGSEYTTLLEPSSTTYWVDAAAPWSLTNPLGGSNSTERWETAVASGTLNLPATLSFEYFHQYLATVGYSTVGGGSPDAPSLTSRSLGRNSTTDLSTTIAPVWLDAGAPYSVSDPLASSTETERWWTQSSTGSLTGVEAIAPIYFHQFSFQFSYSTTGGGAPESPRLVYDLSGGSLTVSLSQTPAQYWLDSGSRWSATSIIRGQSFFERWASPLASGQSSGPNSVSVQYYHQYLASVSYSITGGGSPVNPTLTFRANGSSLRQTVGTKPIGIWLDNGTSYIITDPLPGSTRQERWHALIGLNGTISTAIVFDVAYYHQFLITVIPSPSEGGVVSPPTGWYNLGTAVTVFGLPKTGYQFEGWNGIGLGSNSGSNSTSSIVVNGPVNETAIFYPGLTIHSTNDGTLTYSHVSLQGSIPPGGSTTVYVPVGDQVLLSAIPSSPFYQFNGWSGGAVGANNTITIQVDTPKVVNGSFGVNLSLVAQIFGEAGVGLISVILVVGLGLMAYQTIRGRSIQQKET